MIKNIKVKKYILIKNIKVSQVSEWYNYSGKMISKEKYKYIKSIKVLQVLVKNIDPIGLKCMLLVVPQGSEHFVL